MSNGRVVRILSIESIAGCLIFAASASATFLGDGASSAWVQASLFLGLFVLAATPACAVWLFFGVAVKRVFNSDRAWHWFNGIMGALSATSVVLIHI